MNLDRVLMAAAGLAVVLGLAAAVVGTLLGPDEATPATTTAPIPEPPLVDTPDVAPAPDPVEEEGDGGSPGEETPDVKEPPTADTPDAEPPPTDVPPPVADTPPPVAEVGPPLELGAALEGITEDDLRAWLEALASDDLQGRRTGTEGATRSRELLAARLREAGVAEAGPGYAIPFELDGVQGVNLVAVLPGTDLADQVVVLGAHYDGKGMDPSLKGADTIYNGADDNASGTVVALAVARALRRVPLRRTVLIAFFDANAEGLAGSRSYAASPIRPLEQTIAMVAVDTVGRSSARAIKIFGVETSPSFRGLTKGVLQEHSSYPVSPIAGLGRLRKSADSFPFQQAGVPVLILHTAGHKDEGKVTDEASRVESPRLLEAARFTAILVHALATSEEGVERP